MRLKIKEYREELQLTQKELADKIGSLQRNVSNWETGAAEPDCETILKLAELFNISIDDLFGRNAPDALQNSTTAKLNLSIREYLNILTENQKLNLLNFFKSLKN